MKADKPIEIIVIVSNCCHHCRKGVSKKKRDPTIDSLILFVININNKYVESSSKATLIHQKKLKENSVFSVRKNIHVYGLKIENTLFVGMIYWVMRFVSIPISVFMVGLSLID
jgi:hypothetical protein